MSRKTGYAERNPFSTGAVRPGQIPYRFPDSVSPESLVLDLRRHSWRGQIVGPHGTGKSTLLETLAPTFERHGRQLARVTLHQGVVRLPCSRADVRQWDARTQVIVDGFEQLWRPSRWWLHRQCRRTGAGLLVTAHDSVGLPDLWRTHVDPELAKALVQHLQSNDVQVIAATDAEAALAHHAGNLREAFFELYDLYEQRVR